ncbi:DUF4097 family beta strand repeat-containing protein [Paenibacillus silvisoli]|uniref:DUF4097 family beta strand repeat-containing protein n=1 Tax=Paenibacillus silvisoli TaxID=3110539 RepID=UPI002804ADB5|nr:DUF4097 family beta strand repeat-containing protein [Paenibacillus silvisoli]
MFRKKRTLLLALIPVVIFFLIVDIWTKDAQLFGNFARQFVNEQKMKDYEAAHKMATAAATREIAVDGRELKQVSLSGAGGAISVHRSSEPEVRLSYTVTISAANQEKADRIRDAVNVKEEITDGRLTFVTSADGENVDYHSTTIDYVLSIPDGMKLSVASEHGSVRIDGLQGDVEVNSVNGLLEMVRLAGTISVSSDYSSVYLSDIKGKVGLTNQNGDANLDQIAGGITLDSESGRIFVSRSKGGITGETEDGPVYLSEIAGTVKLKGEDAAIQLDQILGDTQIRSITGQTKLILADNQGYTLHAKTSGGSIRTHLPLPIEQNQNEDDSKQLSGVVGDGTWKVDVETISGNIVINAK